MEVEKTTRKIGIDKIMAVGRAAKKGMYLMQLDKLTGDNIKNYSYLIQIVNHMEKRGMLTTKKIGRTRVINTINPDLISMAQNKFVKEVVK